MDVIIANARDQQGYDYLVKRCGLAAVQAATAALAGNRKPYVSNIAKVLKIELPVFDDEPPATRELAAQHLATIRAMLAKR